MSESMITKGTNLPCKIFVGQEITSEYDKSILEYALNCYSFVLPFNGRWELKTWIELIKRSFDENEVHNKEVIRVISKYI